MNKKIISVDQSRDSGLALLLILLLVTHFSRMYTLLIPALVVVLILMVWPVFFKPFAWVWFGLSEVLGSVVSRILLSIVFFIVVMPVGIFRRIFGADSMRAKDWKTIGRSVFVESNHTFSAEDIENPY